MSRWFATGVCVVLFSLLVASAASAQSSDMFVTKTSPASATEGSDITYTVDIGNAGPDAAPNATLTDTLPATGKFVSESQSSGPTFSCTKPAVNAIGGTVTCTIASFANGATAEFAIVINAPTGTAGTTLINTATVSSDNPDGNTENNTSSSGTTISGGNLADIGVSKTGPASAVPGSSVTFTITVTNFGPNDSGKVTLNDTLGAGFSGMTVTQTSGPTFSCPGNTTPCSIATLPNGSSATFSLVTTISSTPGTYTNTASVTSPNDPNPENDSANASVIASSSDVGVTKTGPATATAGLTFTYTITLTNSGPDPANTASFSDALPAGILFVGVNKSFPAGSTGNCATPPLDQNGTVACDVSPLLKGASATFTITVEADPSIPNGTVVTNTALASSDTPDPNPNNNSSSASTTISANADLMVTKSGPASVTAGTAVTYTITVMNGGPSNAASASMSDTLPAGMTFNSLMQTSGPAFTCTTGATVTCSIASLPVNQPATFQLVANLSDSASGMVTNTATVSSTTPDSTPGNNNSSSTASVTTSADLAVTKTGPTQPVPAFTQATFTITVVNHGPSSAANVVVNDTIPAGLTFMSATPSQGSCNSSSPVVCSLGTLASGATATITIVTQAGPPATGITNTASVASSTPDPNPANNNSSAAAFDIVVTNNIPAASSFGLMLLAIALALGGALILRR